MDGARAEHLREATTAWVEAALADPECRIVVVEVDGEVVSCAMARLEHGAPAPSCPSGTSAVIFNVVTRRHARGLGHARRCLEALLKWAGQHADRADLQASDQGASLYASLGFAPAAYHSMRRPLGPVA
ncbi:MAG: GNAT family N-acetyltransferase [Actinomyces sp.]|uniref:GNAT family N-acetyltransferase n=1 Tax=Actinomyces sp. TaxID=29317 RepID=UPI0026DD528B|nr:GNAT family N-acetyltransferase [Actinomyces sp.]MDO4244379.1 GNAT family N-acetyltransferase [Actinomyces sp.]